MTPGRWASWGLLAVVLAVALVVGAGDNSPPSDAERIERITRGVRCPTCRSQSVADSDAPAARIIREDVLRRVVQGQSDEEIEAYLFGRYGESIRLEPARRGVSALVWALPVVGLAAAVAGLTFVFRRRWRPRGRPVSAEDRALVERALLTGGESGSDPS